jgi:type I restriction enzyme S subunit
MKTYKIVYKNQFTYIADTSRRGDKIAIALNNRFDKMLVSQAYTPFEVKDRNELDPEYLMMWFRRPEFDRYARFKSHGSAREIFDWEEMCNTLLPIPHITKQREIVKEYNILQNRITLNQQLIQKLEETAQAIYREWFVENRDERWEIKRIDEVAEIKAGGDKPKVFSETKTEKYFVPIFSNGVTNEGLYGFTDKAIYPEKSITVSARGTIGYCVLRDKPFVGIVRLLVIMPFNKYEATYLFDNLKRIEFDNSGSVQNQLTIPQISTIEIVMPPKELLKKYDDVVSVINNQIELKKFENEKLTELKELLLAKLATVE